MKKQMNLCLYCGTPTQNKEFCKGECRKKFNMTHKENDFRAEKRSFNGLRA